MKEKVGTIDLERECQITDPCYPNDFGIYICGMVPGRYNCYVEIPYGTILSKSWIIHEDYDTEEFEERFEPIRFGCGVDSGLLGYFSRKQDFDNVTWNEFCDSLGDEYPRKVILDTDDTKGFVTTSGFGDGAYSGRYFLDGCKAVAIEVEF